MRFSELAIVCERIRLGDSKLTLTLNEAEARQAYALLFPDKTLTERQLVFKVANELGVPYEVLMSLEASSIPILLASESSASNSSEWSLEEALRVRNATTTTSFSFLSLSKQMDGIDAHLFWDSVLGKRMPISSLRFLKSLNPKVPHETITNSRSFLTDSEIITSLYGNTDALLDPKRWYEKPTAGLRKRKWKAWNEYTTVALDTFQAIPSGTVTVEYDEDKNIIIEKVGKTITDIAYPEYPTLPLKERLVKYADSHEDADIAWPEMIPSWESIVKREGTIRFPNTGAFSPTEYGGYILVRQSHISKLRIASYKSGDALYVKLHALDGDEYIDVGLLTVQIPSERAAVIFNIERMIGSNTEEAKSWREISDDVCIVLGVSSPFVDRRTNTLSEPSLVEVMSDMGISDLTQYVDLVGIDAN
jgi:hypothetical protein